MAMMTPLQTCFAEHVKLGHDGCGPTAEICTPTTNGKKRHWVIAESVANWLGESHYIGGFRIHSSDSRARQAKNIEALVFHHMQFFGGQDNIDTIRRNSNESILNANQLVLRLASQVQVAETRIQELEASLMAAQKMSAAHEADSKVWERKALDEKDKNISEIHKIGDSLHRNNGHGVPKSTRHNKLAPYHLVSPESQARIQSGCLHDLLANYARLCGDTGDMKAVFAAMRDSFLKYSTEVTPESNGVHKDHVLPCMVDLVLGTPRWKDKLWKQFVKEHLDGIDIDKYIEIKEIKGLGQLCERALRSQVGLLLPAENRSLQATKDINCWAKGMFG